MGCGRFFTAVQTLAKTPRPPRRTMPTTTLTGGQPFGKPKPGKVQVPSETLLAQCNRNNFLLAQMRRATRISRNER